MIDLNQPAGPITGDEYLPTPALPASPEAEKPQRPGGGSATAPETGVPAVSVRPTIPVRPSAPVRPAVPVQRRCPAGFRARRVQNNQSFSDLLIENNVSYSAMRAANPDLPDTRLSPNTLYCAPPAGSRGQCENGGRSYAMGGDESLSSLAGTLGVSPGRLLSANPNLAPGDFRPGQVVCLP